MQRARNVRYQQDELRAVYQSLYDKRLTVMVLSVIDSGCDSC